MNLYSQVLSSAGMPLVGMFSESKFWSIFSDLTRNGGANLFNPPEAQRLETLRSLLEHASEHVPFYRERMAAAGLDDGFPTDFEDYRRLPLTTKKDIAANFPDRITPSKRLYEPWRYVSTSGTVERLTAIWDFRKRDANRATQMLGLHCTSGYQPGMKYAEIPPDVCRDVCGATPTIEPPLFRFFWDKLRAGEIREPSVKSDLRGLVERQVIYRRLVLPSFRANSLLQSNEALDAYLDQLDEFRPYVLKALPAYLYVLALYLKESGRKPPRIQKSIMPMGSSLTAGMRKVVEDAFQKPVLEDYGCAELGCVAAQSNDGKGLRPFKALFHLEVLRNGEPAPDGVPGRVIITDFSNYAMPMLRYDIGDVAVRHRGANGHGDEEYLRVEGRIKDALVSEDGKLITGDQACDALYELPSVLIFQLVAKSPTSYAVDVVPVDPDNFDKNDIEEALTKLIGPSITVRTRVVKTILPEVGGKYRFVKNMTPQADALL